jgi:hypothetical protein
MARSLLADEVCPPGHNVKILMSIGGATVNDCGAQDCTGEYRFDNVDEANRTAEEMYYMFFAGTAHNSYTRPFGGVQLDGVDLDIGGSLAFSGVGLYAQTCDVGRGDNCHYTGRYPDLSMVLRRIRYQASRTPGFTRVDRISGA